jgi:formylglycine-generating enzyme required for sulfatase activity
MAKTKQVFISYATKDAEFAHRLADDLKRLGVPVWIAPESIRPGESWVSAIERGLEESSHVVVVLTPAALESRWVKKETDIAIARERKGRIQVIPLNVERCAVPLFLSSYQMVSFRSDYDVGLSQLAEILGIRLPPEPATAPTTARPALPWKWLAGGGAVVVVVAGLIIALVSGGGLTTRPTSTPEAAALAPAATPTTALTKTPTSVPPTSTPLAPAPTDTPLPPTNTPTPTPLPPTATDTPMPPTDTPPPSAPSSDMVHVPAGEFTMGSDEGDSDEQPVHTVYLDAFYIDKTEVTNAQFAAFVSATGYETGAEQTGCGWIYDGDDWDCIQGVDWQHLFGPDTDLAGKDEHPVVQVSWNDAKAYCGWAGARLPTEAEWEKAARGTDERTYPWGNTFDGSQVNFADKNTSFDWSDSNWDDGYAGTAPVGSYPDGASPYGALDMAGNVWEWVADWYDGGYYAASPESNPKGPASGGIRVIRGGSWDDSGASVRAADRYGDNPVVAIVTRGFRCAR